MSYLRDIGSGSSAIDDNNVKDFEAINEVCTNPEALDETIIPDRVLIRDRFSGEWLFPTQVHYVFEGENIPDSIPKDFSILAELGGNSSEIKNLSSFSPNFLAYDATIVLPASEIGSQVSLVPEETVSSTLSTLVIDGVYSNPTREPSNPEIHVNQLLDDFQEGKVTLGETLENLDTSFCHRNQTLQSILDLEASDHQKVIPSSCE